MENNNYAYIKYVMGAKNANAFKIKLNTKREIRSTTIKVVINEKNKE